MLLKLRKNITQFPIEKILGQESSLTILEIHSEGLESLPNVLMSFTAITNLTLVGCSNLLLPKNILQLPSLKIFKLKNCVSNINNIESLSSNLETLQLNNCDLNNLPDFVYQQNRLSTLDISQNSITNFNKEISSLANLNRINMDSNSFESLPDEFYRLPKISHLSIDNNPLDDITKQKIYDTFKIWLF